MKNVVPQETLVVEVKLICEVVKIHVEEKYVFLESEHFLVSDFMPSVERTHGRGYLIAFFFDTFQLSLPSQPTLLLPL